MRARLATLALLLAAACGGGGSAPPAVALAFSVEPGDASAVAPLAPAVRVELRDAGGRLAAGAAAEVTLALVAPAGGPVLGGTVTRAAVGGVATFADLRVNRPGTGYRLAAAATGLAGATSAPFDVVAGPAARLLVTNQPADGRTATPLAPALEVWVEDAAGNAASGEVTVRLAAGPAGVALGGTTTAAALGGWVSFADLVVTVAGDYELEVSAAGAPAVRSGVVTLTDAWRSLALDGGPVAVAADPGAPLTALAGGQPQVGLWRTTDGGGSWTPVQALRGRDVRPEFQAPGVAWAVGDSVWRSTDGGVTWVESPGLVRMAGGAAVRPAFDPGGVVYLAVNDYESRLLASADAGATWSEVTPALPAGGTVLAVAAGPGGLAVLTGQGFRALPAGATQWTSPVAVDFNPTRLLLHPVDPQVAFVAGFSGIQRSDDGGATWTQVVPYLWKDLAFDPSDSTALVGAAMSVGVFRSTDGGATFEPLLGPQLLDVASVSVAGGRLWLGADTGPFTSGDGGLTWEKAAGGLRVGRITAVAVSPADPLLLVAGTEAGEVWRSADGGDTWARVRYMQGQWARHLVFDPQQPDLVYLADGGRLVRSADAGLTWAEVSASPPGLIGFSLCRAVPGVLWVTDQNGLGAWRSADAGATWTRVATGASGIRNVGEVAADASDPLRAWLEIIDYSASAQTGLYVTADGGATWTKAPVAAYAGRLAAGPAGVVWSYGGTVDRSADGGATFAAVTPPVGGYVAALAADLLDGGRAVVGASPPVTWYPSDGAWFTDDGGATWFHSVSGHDRFPTTALALHPTAPPVAYAGTRGGGLLVTITSGR